MSLPAKAISDFITEIVNVISGQDVTIDTGLGPVNDTVIQPLSNEALNLYNLIQHLSIVIDVANWQQMTNTELEALADTYGNGMQRLGAGFSVGTFTFVANSRPQIDIQIPAGTPLSAGKNASGQTIMYMTTQSATMLAANASTYFVAANNDYEITVPIVCLTPGSAGTVATGAITTILRVPGGIDSGMNQAATSAVQDVETNQELASRVIALRSGYALDTFDGFYLDLKGNAGVQNFVVVAKDNPLLVRASSDANAVDIWVKDTQPQNVIEYFTFNGKFYRFTHQPVISIQSVLDANGNDRTSQFVLVKDTGAYAYSPRGQDQMVLLSGTLFGQLLHVSFTYDYEESYLANYFATRAKAMFGLDILARAGIGVNIYIGAKLTVLSGFVWSTVQSQVVSSLLNYVVQLPMGAEIERADLIYAAKSVNGVDNFVFTDCRFLTDPSGLVYDLPIAGNQYAILQSGNLVVTSG